MRRGNLSNRTDPICATWGETNQVHPEFLSEQATDGAGQRLRDQMHQVESNLGPGDCKVTVNRLEWVDENLRHELPHCATELHVVHSERRDCVPGHLLQFV